MTIFFPLSVARRALPALLGVALAGLCSPALRAAPVIWQNSRFDYVADHKDLKDVLRDFSASQHLMTWISPNVEGTVSGSFSSSPQLFLEQMASSFGVLWYYDGAVLRIAGANEARSATVGLAHASVEALRGALRRLQIEDPRFPVRYDAPSRTVLVSGPPRFVELVTSVAAMLDHDALPGSQVVAQRFPLRYAWATDRSLTVNGRAVTVRGVATVLRSLYGQSNPVTADPMPPERAAYRLPDVRSQEARGVMNGVQREGGSGPAPLPGFAGFSGSGMSGEGGAGLMAPLPGRFDGASEDSQAVGATGVSGMARGFAAGAMAGSGGAAAAGDVPPPGPTIEADSRSNSVLIRDRAENMSAFGTLIHSLDLRPGILEIDASIIEITDNALQELGVDWQVHSSHLNGTSGTGRERGREGDRDGERDASPGMLPATPGGVLTAVIGSSGRYLLSRISVLQQSDQARIIASPKVETLDNLEAVMENKQTFYVQVGGYQSSDLYSVSAGVSLRVLPMIVTTPEQRQIRMDMHIEDGRLSEQKVGLLPIVDSSTIDTQALIREGESLLIAGYSVDQNDHEETALPLLSKIPVLGALFRFRHSRGHRMQRLFLLTPRILSAGVGEAASAGAAFRAVPASVAAQEGMK
ncbi:type III secretion system outer membrane ring subunit SctC [Paraburkholderia bonniea]|uniref:type III secretion system outer membrane ring subunit SctC n=1 Tax=Paraburkholderia bonniea TaxID=2152891 RepID=UPI001292091F|nr:type III secretion system outer membrane ring subunit SctC [Paraburkholderia bonniea]